MNPETTGALWTIGGIALAAILGWIGTLLVKRMREPTRIESLWDRLDKLTKEIYGDEEAGTIGLKRRLENTERRDAAKARVIRDLSQQWPQNNIPKLNPMDLDDLEEGTVPLHWRFNRQGDKS